MEDLMKNSSFIETYDKFKIDETKLYKIEDIDGYNFYLIEKLGNSNVLDKYSNLIANYITEYLKNGGRKQDMLVMKLLIKELGINETHITFSEKPTSAFKSNNIFNLNINNEDTEDLLVKIDHELQHIYINEKGNKTKNDYFTANDLIQKTSGYTKGFLTLYYLSFKDEISANIHMFHREIGQNNIKKYKEFKEFLNTHKLYDSVVKRMIPFSEKVEQYKNAIIDEGNEKLLVKEFGISLDKLLNKASKQIKEAGEEYRLKLSKAFSF